MYHAIQLIEVAGEGFIITNHRGALGFLLSLDGKGWLDRATFNRGRNFFLAGVDRLAKFKAYCIKNNIDVIQRAEISFDRNTYDDHNAHVYAFRNAPLNQKKVWCKLKIAEIDEIEFHDHPDTYYSNMDRRREYAAALVDKSPLEYDPMGVWFGSMSN